MIKQELYFSVDVETDGPIPGPHSMLSFGVALFTEGSERPIQTFYRTLDTLPEAKGHPETLDWWKTVPETWALARKDPSPPEIVMADFVQWVELHAKERFGDPIFVAYPAGFDFLFMYWYMMKFAGKSPFSFSALDIKTFGWSLLQEKFRNSSKKTFPKEWIPETPHNHHALADAIEQGVIFLRMLRAKRSRELVNVP